MIVVTVTVIIIIPKYEEYFYLVFCIYSRYQVIKSYTKNERKYCKNEEIFSEISVTLYDIILYDIECLCIKKKKKKK